jgi:transposase-like protein
LKLLAYPYLQIDARYEHVRVEGRIISQAALVVIGVNAMGVREILDWRLGDSENEVTWGDLFRDLKDRGLHGVLLVTSDAHKGIRSALQRHFQGASWQRCQVHFQRDLRKKVATRYYGEIHEDIKAVLAGEDSVECMRRGKEMSDKWQKRYPKVAEMLEGLEDCLQVLSFPEEHRKRLATTNQAESLMRQLRRRTAAVCVFPNRASCDRLIGAQLIEIHEKWMASGRGGVFNMADLTRHLIAKEEGRVA